MYSILLVEDEIVELETLKNFVNWEACGISKVYSARGARSAMGIVAEHEPDIIITDIQMPKISGIELARMIREEGYSCRIVFLTGYDKFEYARQAVQLHVEEFLLKPFQVDEVETLICRLVQDIKKEKQDLQRGRMGSGKLIEQMCLGLVDDLDAVCSMYFHDTPKNLAFQLVGLYMSDHTMQAELEKIAGVLHCVRMDKITFVILSASVSPVRFMDEIKTRWPDYDFRAILTKNKVSAAELARTCHELQTHQDELFFVEKGRILHLQDLKRKLPSEQRSLQMEERDRLLEAVIVSNESLAISILLEIFYGLEGLNQESYCRNIFRLYIYLREKTGFPEQPILEDSEILQVTSAKQLRANMIRYIKELAKVYQDKDKNQIPQFVKDFIKLHYRETCTVEEMTEVVGLSPNYLRRIFKDETGVTILEYLTDYRMEKARDLLRKTNRKVKDISQEVGYENVSYFTKLFTKKYNLTPNEYRRSVSP